MDKIFSTKRDVYLDIVDRYEKFIRLGVIKSGEKLPSVRTAASELRVNPNTVQRAYSLLEERGFVRSVPKKGAFVIFASEGEPDTTFKAITEELIRLKSIGISRDKILNVLEEVYRND